MNNIYKLQLENKEIVIELNKYAKQASGACMISYGDTQVLSTCVHKESDGSKDFFPLVVNYEEKLYALGKIPGSFQRREGRPSELATLACRLIDRPIRPLFPDNYKDEIQLINTVMSLGKDYEPEILSIIGSSLCLSLAQDIPFQGPIGAVHVGLIDNNFILNPSVEQREVSELELRVAGTKDAINMVEAKAHELSEQTIIEAIMFAHKFIKEIVSFQETILKELSIQSKEYIYTSSEIEISVHNYIKENFSKKIKEALMTIKKQERIDLLIAVKDEMNDTFNSEDYPEENVSKIINKYFSEVEKNIFRDLIIKDKYRVDGRKLDQIRDLDSQIDILKRAHGSSVFTRGETQAIVSTTLGMKIDSQLLDGFELDNEKRFMLHYNFPPYSVGETGRVGAPGRREIGHGNLAEKALSIVMPTYEQFPYSIRIVSEITESNGSSSQASICGGSLSLMAAGVPIKDQVAGIAMGLIKDDNGYSILTDIQGLEDHLGDMDFKVAGTKNGICAIQMDIKISGITQDILKEALEQALKGRLHILEHMNTVIDKPRTETSKYAPKIETFMIKPEKIRDVIGKNGVVIDKIIEQTDVKIDIEDTGQVSIYSTDKIMIQKAKELIENIVKEYEVGQQYKGLVSRIEKYGAFVKFDKDKEALIHISDLKKERVEKVEDVLKLQDNIDFVIKEVDDKGRIKGKLIY